MIKTVNVLMVSYYFPPYNFIGALRIGKLAKYLSQFGWEPWVLTLQDVIYPSAGRLEVEIQPDRVFRADLGGIATHIAKKRTLNRESERGQASIIATSSLRERFRHSLWTFVSAQFLDTRFPDRALPWFLPALVKGGALLKAQKFDAIFSSHGPPSSHLVASSLSKRFDVPWLADFRDLWSQNHIQIRKGVFQIMEAWFERKVMGRAMAMTTVSLPLAQQLQSLHGKKVFIIPNGFDEMDYNEEQPVSRQEGRFVITYTGKIYPGKRDPSIIFEAVRRLIDQKGINGEQIELHFYGSNELLLREMAVKYGVNANLKIFPMIPHKESIRRQIQADVLLLLEWAEPSAKGVYTGKIFEYLGARRPIIATGLKGGVIDDLLRETRSGALVEDVNEVVAEINKWRRVKKEKGTTWLHGQDERIQHYTRRHQAQQLANVLNIISMSKIAHNI